MSALDNLLGDLEQLAIAAAPQPVVEEEEKPIQEKSSRPTPPRIIARTAPTYTKKKKAPPKKEVEEEPQIDLDDLISQISSLTPPKEEPKPEPPKPAAAAPAPKPTTKPVLTRPTVTTTTTTTTTPAAPKPAAAPAPKPAPPKQVYTPPPPAPKPAPPKAIGTCGLCKKNIFENENSLDIKGQKYHKSCFKCADCGAPLQSYYPSGGKFYCVNCIKKMQGNAATVSSGKCCAICGKAIDASTLQAGDKYYHRNCFKCAHCGKMIAGTYGEVNGKIYCSNECIREATGTRCNGCGKVITGPYINVLNKPYHKECLCCKVCKKPFPDLKFYNVNNDPYCADCATKALSQ